jgi:hypothetical protein
MFRLRVFLMWLMMLAVPLQGYAAASMALCGAQQTGARATMADSHAGQPAHAAVADHASHHHHEAAAEAGPDDGPNASHTHGDGVAKCSTCVACHAVALTVGVQLALLHALPQADLAEPASAMAKFASDVPDKPPRA